MVGSVSVPCECGSEADLVSGPRGSWCKKTGKAGQYPAECYVTAVNDPGWPQAENQQEKSGPA